ncbi:MAG: hypothetical protein J2P30_23365, partial [Actinobacteria bacterium]|nr:hypothetical protein [Actinomycetota bacterium]
ATVRWRGEAGTCVRPRVAAARRLCSPAVITLIVGASLFEREFYRTTVRSDYSWIECSRDSVVLVAYDIFAARRTDV